ncbi:MULTISPECIES: energy-coupled thiamine transporter ThiT [unclassified Butyrivibrio]|uniref:energy-coupled thiamine transporter ThiT n=1 Tax=unclassified Butyrivibrio TaxID=2639466 RepID=UPI000420E209|nr:MULTISPECIES: energy-coupled thiamine transporter ThiT [unclassified Butyrivibrio]SDB50889.1 thiamine transporter [Butyrivibrio sp. INlla16]
MSLFMNLVDDTYELTSLGYGLLVVLFILALVAACFFTGRDRKNHFSVKQLVFAGMCVTLAMITSMIKIWEMPMGGAVTLFSMFFITFVGYLYGVRAGLTSALAYGLLQLIIGPYIISIPQLICDYILAFGALGVSGLFSRFKHGMSLGYIAGVLGRLFFAVLSGVIFFGQYAPEGMSAFRYSLVYNGSYLGAEAVLTFAILCVPAVRNAFTRIKYLANEEDVREQLHLAS